MEKLIINMDYVGILIEREDGKMLFQLRDNNPTIKNKNLWSLFGGGIKTGEKPVEAAIRELKEELGIKIKERQLCSWMVFPGFRKKSYLFKLQLNKDARDLQLMEGSSLGYFSILEILKKKNIVSSLRLLLLLYPLISLIKNL